MDRYEEKKKFLRGYLYAEQESKRLMEERQRYIDMATKITSGYRVGGKVMSGGGQGKIPYAVEKLSELEMEIGRAIEKMEEQRREVLNAIRGLENHAQREVLTRRYINGDKWEKIAEEMNYDYSYVLKLHKSAVKALILKESIECH